MASDESTTNELPPEYPEPSPMEAMLFFNILKNVRNQPDIDWDQVAKDTGLKNEATAKKRFYQVKNKLGLDPRAGSSPRPARKARTAASQDELGQDVPQTPTKVTPTKATPTKATKRRKTSATAAAVCAPNPESPDISSTPATPTTPVHSTGFTPINGSPATPSKAKPKGRTPLTSKPRKTPAATPAADVSVGEVDVAGADDVASIAVSGPVKAEASDAGEV